MSAINGLLGLSGDQTSWTAIVRLEDAAEAAPALDQLEREAIAASLELEALRAEARAAAGRVGVARFRTWLPELGVGVAASHDGEEDTWRVGPALRIGLPLFNQQQGARARAHAELRRSEHLTVATAVERARTARATRQRVLAAHAEARHLRDVVLPLRQRILDETLKQYNAMNASTFELLVARRDLVDGGRQYIDALRRFRHAQAAARALARGAMPRSPMAAPRPHRPSRHRGTLRHTHDLSSNSPAVRRRGERRDPRARAARRCAAPTGGQAPTPGERPIGPRSSPKVVRSPERATRRSSCPTAGPCRSRRRAA